MKKDRSDKPATSSALADELAALAAMLDERRQHSDTAGQSGKTADRTGVADHPGTRQDQSNKGDKHET